MHFPRVSDVSPFTCAAELQGYGVLQEQLSAEVGSFAGTTGCLAAGMCCQQKACALTEWCLTVYAEAQEQAEFYLLPSG